MNKQYRIVLFSVVFAYMIFILNNFQTSANYDV